MKSMISVADLAGQVRALGITAGDLLMIHASMRRVGPVECRCPLTVSSLSVKDVSGIGQRRRAADFQIRQR